MKTFEIIGKVILALATLAGLIYVVMKYGDKIVAWCKGLCKCSQDVVDGEVVAEETPAEEAPAEEAPAEEAPAAPQDQVAEEDFENS